MQCIHTYIHYYDQQPHNIHARGPLISSRVGRQSFDEKANTFYPLTTTFDLISRSTKPTYTLMKGLTISGGPQEALSCIRVSPLISSDDDQVPS